MTDSRLDKSLKNIKKYDIRVEQKIGNIQKTILYFLSMFVIMSIKEKKNWYMHKNALVSVIYVKIGES